MLDNVPHSTRFVFTFLAGSLLNGALLNTAFAESPGQPGPGPASKTTSEVAPAPAAPPAPVAPPTEATKKAARQAYSDAQKAFEKGDFVTAETNFIKANQLIPSANAAYWVAMSVDKQGRTSEAHSAFEALLADSGSVSLGEEKLTVAKTRRNELARVPATVKVYLTPESATLLVDDQPTVKSASAAGTTVPGTAQELELLFGSHKLVASADGYESEERQLTVKPGQQLEERFELKAKAVAVAPPAPVPESKPVPEAAELPPERSKVPAYVTLGIAGASAIVGTIFGIQALGAKSDFNKNPTANKADDVERNALIADMALGVTVTLGITGIVLLTTDDQGELSARSSTHKAAGLRLSPYASAKGGGASAELTF